MFKISYLQQRRKTRWHFRDNVEVHVVLEFFDEHPPILLQPLALTRDRS